MSTRGRLLLVRHGETEWSRDGRHTGSTDLPLLPAGERDAEALRGPLAAFDVGLVVCSPLQRARRTAELAGLRVDRVDPDLREWDYGGYEGLTTPEIRGRRGDAWTVFEDGVVPGETPGETVEEVAARASRVLQRVGPDLAAHDVVLVGHGHALRVLTATYLRQEPRFGACVVLDAGALCVLGHEHDRPAIRAWNARG
ncbi:histidine phosphatase family protein [Phycicoccus sp.]|uniref:histidine phosphatase family protein n=1 Tax=Phycicoccus sp. TaxID=1902410 RepID=UPI002D1FBD08|nr:histidine phosphatase family protein [Phycicoccus sp.]